MPWLYQYSSHFHRKENKNRRKNNHNAELQLADPGTKSRGNLVLRVHEQEKHIIYI